MSDVIDLPEAEKKNIRRFFIEVSDEIDRWLKLAAEVIAHRVGNAVLISYPKANESKLMHVELLPLHDLMVLLIVVLNEAVIKRKMLTFGEELSQDQLVQMANKLNMVFAGLTQSEIADKKFKLTPHEQHVMQTIQNVISDHDEAKSDEPYIEGLRLLLRQPEFTQKEKMLRMMDVVDENRRQIAKQFSGQADEGIQVKIGEECQDEALRDLSLVFNSYGIAGKLRGSIGVIGPTRMDYHQVMATVNYVSELLSDLLSGDFRDE
jgi:heat-inducible transcriptional repressor